MNIIRNFKLVTLFLHAFIFKNICKVERIMGDLHGFPQKIGQHLTFYFNEDFDILQKLYTYGKVDNISVKHFFDRKGLEYVDNGIFCAAQASIGQVYKIQSSYGWLAVKIKYPRISEQIKSDFKLLSFLALITKLLPLRDNPIIKIINMIQEQMVREADYLLESDIQNKIHARFVNHETINVPFVLNRYSDNEMITSEWVNGLPLINFMEKTDTLKRYQAFENFLRFQLVTLFEDNMVHCDPHPGNFLIEEVNNSVILHALDFGCMIKLNESETTAVCQLLLGEYDNVEQLKIDLIVLGFDENLLDVYEPILGDIVSIVLEPFYTDNDYDFYHWRLNYKLNTLLASNEWDRPLMLPDKMIYIVRMFQGLYYYARRFHLKYNWHKNLRIILADKGGKHEQSIYSKN